MKTKYQKLAHPKVTLIIVRAPPVCWRDWQPIPLQNPHAQDGLSPFLAARFVWVGCWELMGVWLGFLLAGLVALHMDFLRGGRVGANFPIPSVNPTSPFSRLFFPNTFLSFVFYCWKSAWSLEGNVTKRFLKDFIFSHRVFWVWGSWGSGIWEFGGGKQDRGAPNSGRPLLLMKFQVSL